MGALESINVILSIYTERKLKMPLRGRLLKRIAAMLTQRCIAHLFFFMLIG